MTKIYDYNSMADLEKIPEFTGIGQYLIYDNVENADTSYYGDVLLSDCARLGWNQKAIIESMYMLQEQLQGKAKCYKVYDENNWGDEQNKNINVVRLVPEKIDPTKPYIILCAGGAYLQVCSVAESYPTAMHMLKRGYQVFVLTYHVNMPGAQLKALDDVAAAIRFIDAHAKEFSLTPGHYGIGGYSAGGNLICTWGTTNAGWKAYGLPKPAILFPIYAYVELEPEKEDENGFNIVKMMLGDQFGEEMIEKHMVSHHIDADYPPCYIVCGKDDQIVPCRHSELLKELLDQYQIPNHLQEEEHAPHGFGDGAGTDAEGWPDKAIDFLESIL